MDEIIKEIKWLFENKPSHMSWSELARRSNVDRRTIDHYRHGNYDMENMRLRYANLLYKYSLQLQYELSNPKCLQDIDGWEYIQRFDDLQRCLDDNYFRDYKDYVYWVNQANKLKQEFE